MCLGKNYLKAEGERKVVGERTHKKIRRGDFEEEK